MQTVLEMLGFPTSSPIRALASNSSTGEVERCLADGNAIGVGEWLIERAIVTAGPERLDVVCRSISYWAANRTAIASCTSFDEIISHFTEFTPDTLTRALLGVAMHLRDVAFLSHPRFAVEAQNLLDVSLEDSVG